MLAAEGRIGTDRRPGSARVAVRHGRWQWTDGVGVGRRVAAGIVASAALAVALGIAVNRAWDDAGWHWLPVAATDRAAIVAGPDVGEHEPACAGKGGPTPRVLGG